jgi:hypothetical protein
MTGKAGRIGRAVLASAGIDVAIGYAVLLVLSLFVSLLGAGGFMDPKVKLADLLAGDPAGAALGTGSGEGVLLVLFAGATILVPWLWKNRLAPLAFTVPLLFTAAAFRPLYEQHRAQQEAMAGLGELGLAAGRMAEQAGMPSGPLDALGIGAWLLFATVIFLAFRGIARVVARR